MREWLLAASQGITASRVENENPPAGTVSEPNGSAMAVLDQPLPFRLRYR